MAIEFCKAVRGRKHRVHAWFNTETMTEIYGVQANVKYGKWAHVIEGQSVLLFDEKADATAKAKELSKAREA